MNFYEYTSKMKDPMVPREVVGSSSELLDYQRSLLAEFQTNGVLYPYEAIQTIMEIHLRDYLDMLAERDYLDSSTSSVVDS